MQESQPVPQSGTVTPDVTVLWRSPQSPRAVDAAITADRPDHARWLQDMDTAADRSQSRWGLGDRIESELVRDEPVLVLGARAGWAQVVCPWQPNKGDPRGYPGWVRTAHLRMGAEPALATAEPASTHVDPAAVVGTARQYLGLPYLWGGVSPTALDCSGLVHLSCRAQGVLVPRDADDQAPACDPVSPGEERLGDLYFFAHPGEPVHHVGLVTAVGHLLHAPGTGRTVVDEPLPSDLRETLVSIGRIRPCTDR